MFSIWVNNLFKLILWMLTNILKITNNVQLFKKLVPTVIFAWIQDVNEKNIIKQYLDLFMLFLTLLIHI